MGKEYKKLLSERVNYSALKYQASYSSNLMITVSIG